MAPTSVVPPISTTSTSPPPPHSPTTSPTSTRSRIRAPFNYLRGHHHSNPAPAPVPPAESPAVSMAATVRQVSTASAPDQHSQSTGTTSWLPTVGGLSGLARVSSATSADGVATNDASASQPPSGSDPSNGATTNGVARNPNPTTNGLPEGKIPTIRFVPHVDPRSTRRPHTFAPMERSVKTAGDVVRVGRFSDRDNGNPVGFKSKVVSRRHCEFWWHEGTWYMKDVGSSSGTFLNHVRLSHPNSESKPYPVHDGDVVQLGIDFKGGEELIFRCVKMKLELNRDAKSINQFNVAAHRRIQNLGKPSVNKADGSDAHQGECAICLLNIAPCQSLFVAPCSHVWHYKCIKPILDSSYPILPCPNCREIADLEAEIEESSDGGWEDMDKAKEEPGNTSEASPENMAEEGPKPVETEAVEEERAKSPEPMDTEPSAPTVGTPPMHIPLSNLNLSAAIGQDGAMPDPSNQTPRNNAGPFVLNGTTGRV